MKKKWLLLLGLALLAAAIAALGLLDGPLTDAAWGFSVGAAISTAVSWFTERKS